MKKILSLTTKMIFAVTILSVNAIDISVDVKLPNSNTANIDNLVDSIKNKITPNIINNLKEPNSLMIKSEIDPSVSAVEFNIKQESNKQMVTYNRKVPYFNSLSGGCAYSSFENAKELTGCELDHAPKVINRSINSYLQALLSADKQTSVFIDSYFIINTQPNYNTNNTVDIQYAYKNNRCDVYEL